MFRFVSGLATALSAVLRPVAAHHQSCALRLASPLLTSPLLQQCRRQFSFSAPMGSFLLKQIQDGKQQHATRARHRKPITGHTARKAIVTKVFVKHPKKPNSGNRQCCKIRLLYNGRECVSYIPGEGHNLQEHSQVLVRSGRRRDLIGVRAVIVRGKFDCAPVKKKN